MKARLIVRFALLALPPCVLIALVPVALSAQAPVGSEFQVNTYTTGVQWLPAVASTANGGFVVVWTSPDGSAYGIFGQRFSSAGESIGDEFLVNTVIEGNQLRKTVSADAGGAFVVIWDGPDADRSTGVFGQRYNSEGARLGTQFQVNSFTTDFQDSPSVVVDPEGGFLVAWQSSSLGEFPDVFLRRYSSSGFPSGTEVRANTYVTGEQVQPAVTRDSQGNFVVLWTGQGINGLGIHGQRFDDAASPLGTEFQVSGPGFRRPIVAPQSGDNLVVVWSSPGADYYEVFGRRLDVTGQPLGGEFQVNTYTTDYQGAPTVAYFDDGAFVVSWASFAHQDGSDTGVFGQRYQSTGAPLGSEFQINTYTSGQQRNPAAAARGVDHFVVVWQSYDASGVGIFGQRFERTPTTPPTGTPTATHTGTATPTHSLCVGDCDGGTEVTVDEIVRGVNMAFELQPISACPAFDENGDGAVFINEIVKAVNNLLYDCGA